MSKIYRNAELTAEYAKDILEDVEHMNNQNDEEQEQTKLQKAMSWCKAHKKQLIFAGIAIAVVGGVIIMKRKGKKPIVLDILDSMDTDEVDRIAPYRDLEFEPDNRWIDATTGEVLDDETVFHDIWERHKDEIVTVNRAVTSDNDAFKMHSSDILAKYNNIAATDTFYSIGDGIFNSPINVAYDELDVNAVKERVSKSIDEIFSKIDVNDIALLQIMTDLK
jgi:hypothetical protein